MAGNYANLLATIASNVYTNHNNEVTAAQVKAALDGIVSSLTAGGYLWKGIATPTSPGSAQTPDERVFYLATTAGTYTYLGGLVVNAGEAAILYWDTAWHKANTGIPLVSVSQNTSTGHIDISVGQNRLPIASITDFFRAIGGGISKYPLVLNKAITNAGNYTDVNGWILIDKTPLGKSDNVYLNVSENSMGYYIHAISAFGGDDGGTFLGNITITGTDRTQYKTNKIFDTYSNATHFAIILWNSSASSALSPEDVADLVVSLSASEMPWLYVGKSKETDFMRFIENPEFAEVTTDSKGRITEATRKNGNKVVGGNLEVWGDELNLQGQKTKNIANPEFVEVTTDKSGKVICGRRKDGTFVEYCDVEYPNGIPNSIKDYVNTHSPSGGKTIKALFIGNSVSQDHITYLPWLLKNTYPELDFEIYIAYIGGKTIKGYVEDVITGHQNIGIFSVAKNTDVWTNYGNSTISWSAMWNFATYDIISYEGYFNFKLEDTSYFKPFADAVRAAQAEPFKMAYLLHQTYGNPDPPYEYTEQEIWELIVDSAETALLTTPVDILLPCGAVTKLVLPSFGQAFLTADGTHNQEGLPCIMGAYVIMETIARYLGMKSKLINNELRITQAQYDTMNIPMPNGTLQVGTENQYAIAQEAALNAIKWSDSLCVETNKSIIQ